MKKVPSGLVPLVAVDRRAPAPIHRQIYDGYRAAIAAGNLRSGQRIPSTRALAEELGVSRIPVLNAYSQLLSEGYFESRIGALIGNCGASQDRAQCLGTTRRNRVAGERRRG